MNVADKMTLNFYPENEELSSVLIVLLNVTRYHTAGQASRYGYHRYAIFKGEKRPRNSNDANIIIYFEAEYNDYFHKHHQHYDWRFTAHKTYIPKRDFKSFRKFQMMFGLPVKS